MSKKILQLHCLAVRACLCATTQVAFVWFCSQTHCSSCWVVFLGPILFPVLTVPSAQQHPPTVGELQLPWDSTYTCFTPIRFAATEQPRHSCRVQSSRVGQTRPLRLTVEKRTTDFYCCRGVRDARAFGVWDNPERRCGVRSWLRVAAAAGRKLTRGFCVSHLRLVMLCYFVVFCVAHNSCC